MTQIKTISVKDSSVWEKSKEIAKREGISLSALINDRLEEYIKIHGEGNPAYSLDKWSENEDFKAVPAFLENNDKWIKFVQNTDDETLKEIEDKAHQLEIIASCYIRVGNKEKRQESNFRSVREMGRYGSY